MSSKTFTMGRTRGPLGAAVMAGMLGGIPVFERQSARVSSCSTRHRHNQWVYGRRDTARRSRLLFEATRNDAFQHVSTRGTRKPSRAERKAMRLKAKGQER